MSINIGSYPLLMTAVVVVFRGIFNHERLRCWTGGALLVGVDPVQTAGDPGIDPRVSLVSSLSPGHVTTHYTWSAHPAPQLTTPMTE